MRIAIRHRPESAATSSGHRRGLSPGRPRDPRRPAGGLFPLLRHVDSDAATIAGLWDQLRGGWRGRRWRAGSGAWAWVDPPDPLRRYQREWPDEPSHMDIMKLDRFDHDNFRHDTSSLRIVADPPWHIDAVGGRSHHSMQSDAVDALHESSRRVENTSERS